MKRGFTLIELIVVVGIISLLSSIIIVSVQSSRIVVEDAKRMSDIHQIELALDRYYVDNHQYPSVDLEGEGHTEYIGGYSSFHGEDFTPEYCAAHLDPKPAWCQLRTKLAPYINLPSPPKGGQYVNLVQDGTTYNQEIRYMYRSAPYDGYQRYGLLAFLVSQKNLDMMKNDGGVYNGSEPFGIAAYEVGSLPKYCSRKYTGFDADWWVSNNGQLCRGGN